jgi:hypothetical protein
MAQRFFFNGDGHALIELLAGLAGLEVFFVLEHIKEDRRQELKMSREHLEPKNAAIGRDTHLFDARNFQKVTPLYLFFLLGCIFYRRRARDTHKLGGEKKRT